MKHNGRGSDTSFEYLGRDSWERPVYEDNDGIIWKDVNPRAESKADLCGCDNVLENNLIDCFSNIEPYFESKRSADDYAFGMLLNGYPAAVMEAPKAVIINNIKKARKESENNAESSEKTKE